MHNILIVEDHKEQNDELYRSIRQAYPNWTISSAYSLEDSKALVTQSLNNNNYYSLFLLDVQLNEKPGDLSGFTLAEEIRAQKPYYKVPILFLTSISDKTSYALSNFHCYNYITKPYSANDIIYQIQQMLITGFLEENSISIIDTNRIKHRILQQDILYIESKSHLVILKTETGYITSRDTTFQTLSNRLTGGFIQCHKKYIINVSHIKNYDKQNRFINVGNHTFPVSRTYQKDIEALLITQNTFHE